jgi:hypothetical protein
MKEWEERLKKAVQSDPALKQKLCHLMWLDEYLMKAIQADSGREYPEMRTAWEICLDVADTLGLPRQQGADWLSYNVTPLGQQIGLKPRKPLD